MSNILALYWGCTSLRQKSQQIKIMLKFTSVGRVFASCKRAIMGITRAVSFIHIITIHELIV